MNTFVHSNSYINNAIQIVEPLPNNIVFMIRDLEYYDRNDPELYFNHTDDLWVNAKNAFAAGVISRKTWDLITEKYIRHALKIAEKEDNERKNN